MTNKLQANLNQSDNLIFNICIAGAIPVPAPPAESMFDSLLYSLHLPGSPPGGLWLVDVLDPSLDAIQALRSIQGLCGASPKASVVAGWESHLCYLHSGELLPLPGVVRAVLRDFNALIISNEDSTKISIIRRGPDPQPWICDWENDVYGNPVKYAIKSGAILGVNPEKGFSKYVEKLNGRHVDAKKREQFLKDAAKASPLTIEKVIYDATR